MPPVEPLPQNPNRPRRRTRVARLAAFLLALPLFGYAAWLATAYFAQEEMIFPCAGDAIPPGFERPADVESIWIDTPDGARVEAWYAPGAGRSAHNPGPAVMFFHGNSDFVDTRWNVVEFYRGLGISGVAVEYRGYGRSTGRPGQAAIVADALRFREWLAARPEVDSQRLILHGMSLGGGVACAVAAVHPPAALVLESTFTSMDAMARRLYLPAFLNRHHFPNDQTVASLDAPVLICHGRLDDLIPIEHARRMRAAARHGRLIESDRGHGQYETDWKGLAQFLRDNELVP
jgi:hypothetical protein